MKAIKTLGRTFLQVWGGFGKAPGLRYQAIHKFGALLHEDGLSRTLNNKLKFPCDLRDHIQRQIYFFGAYEPIESFILSQLIKPGMTVIDAGANIGYYSTMMAQYIGENGHVHSFEPVPCNFESLKQNIKRNELNNRIQVNAFALWDVETELTLQLPHQDNAGTYTTANLGASHESISCPTMTLDKYIEKAGISKVDLIKIDVEGSELKAFRGAQNTLKKDLPLLLLEVSKTTCERSGYTPDALWQYLKQFNYRAFSLGPSANESREIQNFSHIQAENVLLHTAPLPPSVTSGWTYKDILKTYQSGYNFF